MKSRSRPALYKDLLALKVATRSDVVAIRSDMTSMKQELKSDMTAMDKGIRSDMASMKKELKSDMASLFEDANMRMLKEMRGVRVLIEHMDKKLTDAMVPTQMTVHHEIKLNDHENRIHNLEHLTK